QIYKCFGCGKAGDMFSFMEEYNRIDFREAMEDLAKMAGIKITYSANFDKSENKKRKLYEINKEVAKFYHHILTKHVLGKEALEYVKNRGISEETLKKFQIGFSPKDSRLILSYLQKKNYLIDDLIDSGSFGKSNYNRGQYYDRFQSRLIFPQVDFRDRVVGFSGRILPGTTNPNLAKYINSPETDVYHKSQMLFGMNLAKESIKKKNWVLLVEGELDMISPYQAGIENVVAIKGTALTEEQLQLIKRYTDTIILGLDSDFAGNKAAIRSIELADKMDFEIKVLDLEDKYKDPDEAVRDNVEFFKNKIKKAESIWDFILKSAVKNYGTETNKGKKMVLMTILPFLAKINNLVIRSDYLRKVAEILGSNEESVSGEFQKYLGKKKTDEKIISEVKNEDKVEMRERLEERLLILFLRMRNKKNNINKIEWTVPKFKKIIGTIIKYPKLKGKEIAEKMEAEVKDIFSNLYLTAFEDEGNSDSRRQERGKIIRQIREIELKDRLKSLSGIIANLEILEDEEKIAKVEVEYTQILGKLAKLQRTKS
ncbi:DNA primase, partial [Patescibacteria group bacterium]|nr:DNA primase [Patescibacteria group bacterium]